MNENIMEIFFEIQPFLDILKKKSESVYRGYAKYYGCVCYLMRRV